MHDNLQDRHPLLRARGNSKKRKKKKEKKKKGGGRGRVNVMPDAAVPFRSGPGTRSYPVWRLFCFHAIQSISVS